MNAPMDRVGEIRLDTFALGVEWVQRSECTTGTSLVGTCDRECTFDAAKADLDLRAFAATTQKEYLRRAQNFVA